MSKDSNPGMWQSFFGGHLKAGEGYESNALNELNEELGLTITANLLVPLYVKKSDKAKHFSQVFALIWNGDISDLSFRDDEVEQVKWTDFNELERMIGEGKFCNSVDPSVKAFIQEVFTDSQKTE